MTKIKDSVDEIDSFVSGLKFDSPLKDPEYSKSFTSCYKYIHALLLWEHLLGSTPKGKLEPDALLHLRELLSDLSAVQTLVLTGLYKPARMMMRSSIENLLRVAALEQGFLVSGAKFTHELISLVKSSKLAAKGAPAAPELEAIVASYANLCAYTHAATPKFLALKIPLDTIHTFDKKEFLAIIDQLRDVSSRYNRILFTLYHHLLAKLHHKHRDYILDALPRKLKARIND